MEALPEPKWRNWQTRMIQGHVPARVWGFESPLRHQLLTRQQLRAYHLLRPSLRPIFGGVAREPFQAGDSGAEVLRGQVGVPHGHGQGAVPEPTSSAVVSAPVAMHGVHMGRSVMSIAIKTARSRSRGASGGISGSGMQPRPRYAAPIGSCRGT